MVAHTALWVFVAWVSYKLLQVVYNLFFHPLRHFPGPILAKISRWWLFREEMSGDSHLTIQKLHEIHGKIVRISPDELSIVDQKAAAEIYSQSSQFLKAKYFYGPFENHAGNLFTVCEKETHSREKRMMSNSFSRAGMLRNEGMMNTKIGKLMDRIERYSQADEPVPLLSAFRCLALDTITEFCYGEALGALDSEDFTCAQFDAFDKQVPIVPFFQHFPILRQMLRWVSNYELPFLPNAIRQMEKGAEEGVRMIKRRDEKDVKSVTMFQDMILSAKSRNIELTEASLVSQGIMMNFAGTDTTAATLAVGLYHLCKRPDLFLQLQNSLLQQRAASGNDRLSVLELENNKLLDACLKESLRVACPVSGRLPRVVPAGGWDFEGHHIPANSIVGTSPFYECYDKNVFPQPDEYQPERWLVDDTSEMMRYYHPFSRGVRQCIGQNLSLIEQRLAFAEFVMRFRPLEIIDTKIEVKQFITVIIEGGVRVKVGLAGRD